MLQALFALTVVALFAAHLPPRLRLFLLLPIGVGAAAGAILAKLLPASTSGTPSYALPTSALLVALCLLLFSGESFRVWRAARSQSVAAHLLGMPDGGPILQKLESGTPAATPAEAQVLEPYRRLYAPPLAVYLQQRLLTVFRSPPAAPWPAVIWAGELTAGWLAGLAILFVQCRRGPRITVGQSDQEV